jgi:hypothetical protein
MSEHRLNDRCETWPQCTCAQKASLLHTALERDLTREEVDMLALSCACVLHCVRVRCPNPQMRWRATAQLMHPEFAPYRQH